jgi:hypothetical protein
MPERCYLCEESYPDEAQSEHYAERHGPRLVIPAGAGAAGDATIGDLFRGSTQGPALAADVLVLLHHGATALATAQEDVQAGGSVGQCLRNLDDAVEYLVLVRQTLTDAVLSAGKLLLGDGPHSPPLP